MPFNLFDPSVLLGLLVFLLEGPRCGLGSSHGPAISGNASGESHCATAMPRAGREAVGMGVDRALAGLSGGRREVNAQRGERKPADTRGMHSLGSRILQCDGGWGGEQCAVGTAVPGGTGDRGGRPVSPPPRRGGRRKLRLLRKYRRLTFAARRGTQ